MLIVLYFSLCYFEDKIRLVCQARTDYEANTDLDHQDYLILLYNHVLYESYVLLVSRHYSLAGNGDSDFAAYLVLIVE